MVQSNKSIYKGSIQGYYEDEDNCINSTGAKSQKYYIEKCEYSSECIVKGNSVTFSIKDDENEIKANIVVEKNERLNVSGQIRDCRGREAAFLDVILVAITREGYRCIGETTTNSRGCYRFRVSPDSNAFEYKVFVRKH